MARDLSDEEQVKRAEQWGKLDDKARRASLNKLLVTSEGRSYVYDLLQACGVFRLAFSTDALQMSFNTGQQSIGLWVMSDIEAVAPQALTRMIQERNQRNADRTSTLEHLASDTDDPGGWEPVLDNPVVYGADPESGR